MQHRWSACTVYVNLLAAGTPLKSKWAKIMSDVSHFRALQTLVPGRATDKIIGRDFLSSQVFCYCSERLAPQLWMLFAAACDALGLASSGPAAVQLYVGNGPDAATHFVATLSSHSNNSNDGSAQIAAGTTSTAAATGDRQHPRSGSVSDGAQQAAAALRSVPCLMLTSTLVELLQPAELRAAIVAALSPAVLPATGTMAFLTVHPTPCCRTGTELFYLCFLADMAVARLPVKCRASRNSEDGVALCGSCRHSGQPRSPLSRCRHVGDPVGRAAGLQHLAVAHAAALRPALHPVL